MPENLPRAVTILLWLLVGVIIFGYLLMAQPTLYAAAFALVYYGLPVTWQLRKGAAKEPG